MITRFGSLFAGHVDLDDIGLEGIAANDRWLSDTHLASVFDSQRSLAMSASIKGKVRGKVPCVLHGTQSASTTAQTRGMERRPGIDANTAGASKIWLGHVTAAPNLAYHWRH